MHLHTHTRVVASYPNSVLVLISGTFRIGPKSVLVLDKWGSLLLAFTACAKKSDTQSLPVSIDSTPNTSRSLGPGRPIAISCLFRLNSAAS